MAAYLEEPARIPLHLRLGIWIAERKTGKRLLISRLLAWYPKAATGAGVMEALVAHEEGRATARLLKLLRLYVSLRIECSFCVDMNSRDLAASDITTAEVEALQGRRPLGDVPGFSPAERLALRYAAAITDTPASVSSEIVEELRATFSEREIVAIASTVAQVDFWARLNRALGVPSAGFSDSCPLGALAGKPPTPDGAPPR